MMFMDAFDAYKQYVALKNHFTSNTYDYFKYNGAVRAKRESFDRRNDKYFFQKLARRKDVFGYLVALFVYGNKDAWVGDIVRNEQNDTYYKNWQRVNQSLTYVFKNDLQRLSNDWSDITRVVDGQHPTLLTTALRNEIHIETFIMLNNVFRFTPSWNKRIQEKTVWPSYRQLCKKYAPFIEFDEEKIRQIAVDYFSVTK